ncbi:hypothetical protein [Planctobacterium marinum]|uniref:hypothetical protein n=1 Tax=Planctobacterium marinum TaxID=1631968 RepID=UPI001E2E74D1|nr:hypothetical protein [Planctobacterium marinum]MCC2605112.1 hypothetical protein [Planctobacterium marinum]
MADFITIPSVFDENDRLNFENENYQELYLAQQQAIGSIYNEAAIAKTSITPSISDKDTIFGFEAEFAQSVYGRETGQHSSAGLTEDEKKTKASLEYLFHAEIENSPYFVDKDVIIDDAVGSWDLGTDYFDVLELGTPGLSYPAVWDTNKAEFPTLKSQGEPWKLMRDIGTIWTKALYISTSERFYNAIFNQPDVDQTRHHKEPGDKTKDVNMVLAMLRGPTSTVGHGKNVDYGLIRSWGIIENGRPDTIKLARKNFTLHPEEMPNCNCQQTPNIFRNDILKGVIQRNFMKNGVNLVAPQYNVTVPATCAMQLIELGADLDASFDSKYLDALNRLHLGFRKFLTSTVNPQTPVAGFAVTLLAYYLTNICGLPSQIRGDIRTQTKFDASTSDNRKKRYLAKIAEFLKSNKGYEMQAWVYTHSWIKDVAHTWVKSNGVTALNKLLECFEATQKKEFLDVFGKALVAISPESDNDLAGLKQTLSNGDISDPLLTVAKFMDYEFPDRKFIHFVLNSELLNVDNADRHSFFVNYKPGAYDPKKPKQPAEHYLAPQYADSGYQQCLWAINNVVRCFKFHLYNLINDLDKISEYKAYENITWCRADTYQVFEEGLYKKSKGMLVTEIRDQEFLEALNDDLNLNCRGG